MTDTDLVESTRAFLKELRKEYRGLKDSAFKQLGTRALKYAEMLVEKNPEYAQERAQYAASCLPHAKALDARLRTLGIATNVLKGGQG